VPSTNVACWSSLRTLKRCATKTCSSIGSVALTGQRLVHRAVERSLATLTIVALCVAVVGVSASAAHAAASPRSLRAQVDAMASRYFAAQTRAKALDSQVRGLDQQLSQSKRRADALRPLAVAEAVQLYQNSSDSFTVLLDTTSAMESARRAELISRATDHTQALLDDYANAASILSVQQRSAERARAAQAAIVAGLAKQESALEHALALAQQAYRDQLAAQAKATLISTTPSTTTGGSNVRSTPVQPTPVASPPAPVPVDPPPPPSSGVNPHHDDPFLVCTRTRESSGVYTAVNPGGYYGAYQFSQPTWDVAANHAGMPQLIGVRPDTASPWDQDQLAWVLYEWQGSGPWGGLC